MTTNVFAAFADFCRGEGLDPDTLASTFRSDPQARELLIALEEGRLPEAEFERRLGAMLGLQGRAGVIDRLFAGATLDDAMVSAVGAARDAGVPTGLISNSWGVDSYPRDLLARLFDGVVLSGEVGVRKPAPRIYELGAAAIGCRPQECVFVDDLPFNLPPAQELGMHAIGHREAPETIAEIERALGLSLV